MCVLQYTPILAVVFNVLRKRAQNSSKLDGSIAYNMFLCCKERNSRPVYSMYLQISSKLIIIMKEI